MRKLLMGMVISAGIQAAWSDCTDTTFLLKAGVAGFTTGNGTAASATYNPAALNNYISSCPGATMTLRINLDATEAGKTKDTVKLSGPILIGGRANKITALSMTRPAALNGALDTLFTFIEAGASPALLVDSAANTLVLSNMAFARKAVNSGEHTVNILAKGSQVTGCHFWMADNNSGGLGALVNIGADSVLVERSLFRAPLDGVGTSRAVRATGGIGKIEVRANVFQSTGVFLSITGPFHIIANTFVGSRNGNATTVGYNAIIIGAPTGINFKNAVIMHNLFANKVDTLPPIAINTTNPVTADSILRNAWTQGKLNLPLAATESPANTITVPTSGPNGNIALPRGFSNYGPNSGDVKDYPLAQLRTDPTLARKHPDFGKLYRVFLTGSWAGSPTPMSDISTISGRVFFQSPNFVSFLGQPYSSNLKVGAFANQDTIVIPSPLAAGAQGASFKLQRDTASTDKAKITTMDFDQNYYKQLLLPEFAYFFFSNSLAKLTASNDTTALIAAGNQYVRRQWTNFDSLLTVPKEVRNGATVDIYVKMLHFRGSFMAAVPSIAGIGTLSNFPSFPVNDLTLVPDPTASDYANRIVGFKVTRTGTESIDSVRILTLNEGGQVVGTKTVSSKPSDLASITVTVAAKGTYSFQAVPVAQISAGVYKTGSPNGTVGPYPLGLLSTDSVYVQAKATGCPGDGLKATPFCRMSDALAAIATRNGGTIIVMNASLPLDTLNIPQVAGDTLTLLITSADYKGSRPILRGTAAKEAVTIARKNVTLRGFTIEQPPASAKPALTVGSTGGGCIIDANIFRATSKGAVAAPAISVGVGATADARIVNNVIWGYSKGVQIAGSSSPNIKILFNTIVGDSALAMGASSGISAAGTGDVAAVVANNFFSGLTDPIESGLGGKHPVLDHNVYTQVPDLHGLSESGGLPPSESIATRDVWAADYAESIKDALSRVVDCNSFQPCNPLYAASSANDYNVNVTADAFGNPRVNRKEVGAFELEPGPSSVIGVLEIKAVPVAGTFRKIGYTVTGKSFDPDSTAETDSVQVFWTTSNVTFTVGADLAGIPAKQRTSYPIRKLMEGNIIGTADSIDQPLTRYWFYAALSRNLPPRSATSRKMGFAYSDSVLSNPDLSYEDCAFSGSKSACPSDKGVFGVANPPWKGQFESRVDLTRPAGAGSQVKVPEFNGISELYQYNLDLTSPLPSIHLDAHIAGMESEPKQRMIWHIDMSSRPEISGKELFLLPEGATGVPVLVPDWKLDSIQPGKFRLTFESRVDGPQTYAFGKLRDGVEPGAIAQANTEVPVYDFEKAGDSAVFHVDIRMKGSAFKTANPLVLISTIPAGGRIDPPGSFSGYRVLSKDYPSKTLVASFGYAGEDDSLWKARMYQLYQRASAADSAQATAGLRKPFPLDPISREADFIAATELLDKKLALSTGNLPDMTVKIPVGRLYFRDANKFEDKTGKSSRSLEVVFTVFDGSRILRTRGFIRTRFRQDNILISEWHEREEFLESKPGAPHWNLFGYPWDEADSGSLSRIVRAKSWDHAHMRLMAYKGTGKEISDYVAYDGTNIGDIPFDAGRAVWSGSTERYTPQCLVGMSLDYEPFKLSLPAPNRSYDISLPFNFPMRWQDILDSSGLSTSNVVSLWHYNDTNRSWDAVSPPTATKPSETVLLPWEGYTAQVKAPTTLVFPVADTSRIMKAAAKTASNDGSWVAKVLFETANAGMELRIGRGAGEFTFPEAPNVPGQDFRVALAKDDERVSQYIQPLTGGWQGHWSLHGSAAKGSGGVALRLGPSTRELPVWLLDAAHGTAVPLSADKPVRVSEGELAANDYHLVAGDRAYVEGLLQNLAPGTLLALTNYPNPFAASTLIRYVLPSSFGRTTFDLKVRDFRGRTVWEKTIRGANSLNYMWNGQDRAGRPLPAGVYTLSLSAKPEGKAVYRAVRKLMRM